MVVVKNITWKKRERGSNIIFPIILRLLGGISSGEEGKETEILWEKSRFKNNLGWGRISSCRELYTPLKISEVMELNELSR